MRIHFVGKSRPCCFKSRPVLQRVYGADFKHPPVWWWQVYQDVPMSLDLCISMFVLAKCLLLLCPMHLRQKCVDTLGNMFHLASSEAVRLGQTLPERTGNPLYCTCLPPPRTLPVKPVGAWGKLITLLQPRVTPGKHTGFLYSALTSSLNFNKSNVINTVLSKKDLKGLDVPLFQTQQRHLKFDSIYF